MKKIIRIVLGIISLVSMMGGTVYGVTVEHIMRMRYMDRRIEALVVIGLIFIDCIFIVYSAVKKKQKNIIVTQQVFAIVLMIYFYFRIYSLMISACYIDMGYLLIALIICSFCFVGFLIFVILELIDIKKNNGKDFGKFIMISIIFLIAIIISALITDFGIANEYNDMVNLYNNGYIGLERSTAYNLR